MIALQHLLLRRLCVFHLSSLNSRKERNVSQVVNQRLAGFFGEDLTKFSKLILIIVGIFSAQEE